MAKISYSPGRKRHKEDKKTSTIRLKDGSRVAVMGGGPAGAFFAYFLLELAKRANLDLCVDIYEPRDFTLSGPPGCNMCAGIISESLIQILAMDGINLPPKVVQRGIDSYILHNDSGEVLLHTPELEKRIGTVFRGVGPKNLIDSSWTSFDGFVLEQAVSRGANLIRKRIEGINRLDGCIQVLINATSSANYDFLAVAIGVNTNALRLFTPVAGGYQPPQVTKTFIREYYLGKEKVQSTFGQTIHYFLLSLPGLDFAAIVPKGSYVTICMLGKDMSQELFDQFLDTPQVKGCMPPDWKPTDHVCHCSPRINITGAVQPYAERIVFLGDSGISRLYKDGIGAAYRAAKTAASAVIFSGIGEGDLKNFYGRSSRSMEKDNRIGKLIFSIVEVIKPFHFISKAILKMLANEQASQDANKRMSNIIWDLFTGSAPYGDIFMRILHPAYWGRLLWYMGTSLIKFDN